MTSIAMAFSVFQCDCWLMRKPFIILLHYYFFFVGVGQKWVLHILNKSHGTALIIETLQQFSLSYFYKITAITKVGSIFTDQNIRTLKLSMLRDVLE